MKRFLVCLLAVAALLTAPAVAADRVDYEGTFFDMPRDVETFVLNSYSGSWEFVWRDYAVVAFADVGYIFFKQSTDSTWLRQTLLYSLNSSDSFSSFSSMAFINSNDWKRFVFRPDLNEFSVVSNINGIFSSDNVFCTRSVYNQARFNSYFSNSINFACKQNGGHDWQETSRSEPTCTSSGTIRSTCSRDYCGETKTETIPALSHNYAEVSRTAATCTIAGSINYKCSRCSSTTADIIPPLSHSYSKTGSTAATCTSAGTDTYKCSRCNDVKTEITAQALGHDYIESGRIAATCTTSGSISYHCSRCDSTKTEVIPQLGTEHTWTEGGRTDATCTAPGSVHYTCPVCGETKEEPLPALDHAWEETGRVNAACTAPGSVSCQCSRCGDTKTEVLPQLGTAHTYEVAEVIPATYDANGNITVPSTIRYRCSVCGDEYSSVIGAAPSSPIVEDGSGGDGMFDTTASLGKTFLSGIWGLFGIYVPGFSFTFGQMWLGVLLASISILVVKLIFGFGGGPRGYSPRTGSTSNPRISKERRNDEF